jgi:hypothetical protein
MSFTGKRGQRMNYNAQNQSLTDYDKDQHLREHMLQGIDPQCSQKQQDCRFNSRNIYVEGMEVYADKNYMYCKGNLCGRIPKSLSDIVVAIEWFDQNQNPLKTDWTRVDVHPGSKNIPSSSDEKKPFMIKRPLDPRVRSVKAYAFSSPH